MQTIGLLFKVLWSPGEVMFRVSKNPRVLTPLLFLCLSSAVFGSLMMIKLDPVELAVKSAQRATHRTLTDDEKESLKAQINSPVMKTVSYTSTFINPFLLITPVAVLYFALFTLLGREAGFKAFYSITAFAFVPLIFSKLSAAIAAFVAPAASIMPDQLGSLSPAIFLNRDSMSPVLFAALNTIDLVTIWIIALLIIGYGFAARKTLSKITRAVAVIGLFLVYVALRLGFAALSGI